jgi:hypothetical protein
MSVYTEMHNKYGNPYYVAEFRLFMLNDCFKTCENCFYHRAGNQLDNYDEIKKFALELKQNNYQLETCYLLPTDFFENKDNYALVERDDVKEILSLFLYTGIASTLEGDLDFSVLPKLVTETGIQQIELQVNLINEKLFNEEYFLEVKDNISKLRNLLGDKVVFNLALNLGREITDKEFERVHHFVLELSDDGILEINFTFLYNNNIQKKIKDQKLLESLKSMKKLSGMYNKEESKYNDRTLLRKPAFIFRDDKTYIAPIIPFDEYAFVENSTFELGEVSFDGFLKTLNEIEKLNKPIIKECYKCELLQVCMGKAYLATAHSFNLPCFLGV